MKFETLKSVSRRDFLAAGAASAAALALAPLARAADDKGPWRGFKMGIQSYSMREFSVEKALEASKKLDLLFWETFPGHIKVGAVPAYVAEQREMLKKAGINLVAYGVVEFDGDEAKARTIFDFAKAMGITSISANPKKDAATFKVLDKLVEEYNINIAIHNHGPGALYDKIDDVVNAVKDHHPRVGACVDTGHYLRSKESPVEAIERLKGRVYGVHLKDVKDATQFKIVGEGDLDVLGCLKALRKQNYEHCLALEYEESPKNPVPDLEICLANVRKALAQL
ncbi:MAG: sugar phosphate isomerase/epimerase [Planctomycetota bacterium]|nr:sugar phosphate isomerase/epimerase [Planctomycetota bacterium]